jgi:hypothetical protein
LASLVTGNNGLVTYDNTGTLHPLDFNGNANTFLSGNGTFVSSSSFSPWQISGGNIFYNGGNVGIGTSHPNYPLQIIGNVVDSGTLFANNIAAANGFSIGAFRIVNGAVDSIVTTAGTLQLGASTVNAKGLLNVGQGSSAIGINGITGTISSPSGLLHRYQMSGGAVHSPPLYQV